MRVLVSLACVCLPGLASGHTHGHAHKPTLTAPLSNGRALPLVGVGVGNLNHQDIDRVLREAVDIHGVRIVDTAAASHNEHFVAQALKDAKYGAEVEVITKVWYTHLGYERTLKSVRTSLEHLGVTANGERNVTVLLHWPRCRDEIEWMNCEEEEANLPGEVRSIGKVPHKHPDLWRESWKALETLYAEGAVSSIGVSNFDIHEMKDLLGRATVSPHILQGNLWSYLFDPHLMSLLQEHNVTFQAYNVMSVLDQSKEHSDAYSVLKNVAEDQGAGGPSEVLLGWLAQHGVAVVPRASSSEHLRANSPAAVLAAGDLSALQAEMVRHAVELLMRTDGSSDHDRREEEASGDDARVSATFANGLDDATVTVYWLDPNSGKQVPVTGLITAGGTEKLHTHPGHVFVAKRSDGKPNTEFTVTARYGHVQDFHVRDEL